MASSYIDSNLLPGETVAFRTRLHPIVLAAPAIVAAIFFALSLRIFGGDEGSVAVGVVYFLLAIVSACAIIPRAVQFLTSEYAVTSRRVLAKVGFLRRRSLDVRLEKIESIVVNQGLIGRLFGYGSLLVIGSGGTKETFPTVAKAFELRAAVHNAAEARETPAPKAPPASHHAAAASHFARTGSVLLAALLASSIVSAQARLGLDVVDATDQKVGYVSDTFKMVVFLAGEPYLIGASHEGFTSGGQVFFDQQDCLGTPYMPVGSIGASSAPALFSGAFFTPPDGFLHYPSANSVSRNLVSQLLFYPNGTTFCDNSYFALARIVAPETGSLSPFVPPFRVVEAWPVSPAPQTAFFNDVPVSHPFFRYIEALRASGITGGCGGGNFCPDNPVSRGQMAVFLAKALGL